MMVRVELMVIVAETTKSVVFCRKRYSKTNTKWWLRRQISYLFLNLPFITQEHKEGRIHSTEALIAAAANAKNFNGSAICNAMEISLLAFPANDEIIFSWRRYPENFEKLKEIMKGRKSGIQQNRKRKWRSLRWVGILSRMMMMIFFFSAFSKSLPCNKRGSFVLQPIFISNFACPYYKEKLDFLSFLLLKIRFYVSLNEELNIRIEFMSALYGQYGKTAEIPRLNEFYPKWERFFIFFLLRKTVHGIKWMEMKKNHIHTHRCGNGV